MSQRGKISKRQIVEAANRLLYTKGYNATSFADVADAVGIAKGNLQYHFNSKEALLNAIVAGRIESIAKGLSQWDVDYPDAKARLRRFVQMLRNEETDLVRYGCPMGTINVELGKFQSDLQDGTREMFDLYRHWLEKVFKQLGKKNAKAMSQHLLSMAQGAVLLSYVYTDPKILKDECALLDEWIDGM